MRGWKIETGRANGLCYCFARGPDGVESTPFCNILFWPDQPGPNLTISSGTDKRDPSAVHRMVSFTVRPQEDWAEVFWHVTYGCIQRVVVPKGASGGRPGHDTSPTL